MTEPSPDGYLRGAAMPDSTRSAALVSVLAGLALVVGGAELVARLYGGRICTEVPGAFYRADAVVGWRHLEHVHGRIGVCDSGIAPPVPMATGAEGLLDPAPARAKPPGTRRALILGGALPEGLGVWRDANVARVLEQLADRRRGAPFEVVNASVAGWSVDNALSYFRTEGKTWEPDLVLLFVTASHDFTAVWPPLLRQLGGQPAAKPYYRVEDGALLGPEWLAPLDQTPATAESASGSAFVRLLQGRPARIGVPFQSLPPSVAPATVLHEDRAAAVAVTHALVRTLRDECTTIGAHLAVVLTADEGTGSRAADEYQVLMQSLGVTTIDLRPLFGWLEAQRKGYLLGHRRWDREGHFVAARGIFAGLGEKGLLPAGVVPAITVGGGLVAEPPASLGALRAVVWNKRFDAPVTVLVLGLVLVGVSWAVAWAPAMARDLVGIASGAAVLVVTASPALAAACLGAALAWWIVTETLPGTLRRVVLWLVGLGLVSVSLWWAPRWVDADALTARQVASLATGVLLLRVIAYAADRGSGRSPRLSPVEYLAAALFFPLLVLGPDFTVSGIAARRRAGDGGVPSLAALGRGLAYGVAGMLVLLLAPEVLNRPSVDVFATGGEVLSLPRLWAWVLEPVVLVIATIWGWTTLGRGLASLVGCEVPADVTAPALATSVRSFWIRGWRSLTVWLDTYVFRPAGGTERPTRALLLTFVAGALWYAWGSAKLLGSPFTWPFTWIGALVWAVLAAVLRRLDPRPSQGPAALIRVPLVWFAVALVSLFVLAPPRVTPTEVGVVLRRLIGLS